MFSSAARSSQPAFQVANAVADGLLHIVLVRHGQTDANHLGIVQGHQPTSLNETGHRQAELVARRLVDFQPPIRMVISSDLPRAVQTAAPLAQALGLPLHQDRVWRERCYGAFEGKGPQERQELRRRLGLADDALPPGAQSEADYQHAIREALLGLTRVDPETRSIAVVTHGGACRAVAMMLADGRLPAPPGLPVPAQFACPNASVTHLVHSVNGHGPQFRYECLFDVEHLAQWAQTTVHDAG